MPTRPDGGNYSRSGSSGRRSTSTNSMDRRSEAEYQQRVTGRENREQAEGAYLKQLQQLIYGSGMDQGGGGQVRRGGGGGGGGGGASAYDQFRIAEEKRRQAELDRRKKELTAGLQGARNQAIPLLKQYGAQYNKDIGNIFAQNRGLNAGYANQLKAIQGQMNQGTQGTQAMLQRDLGAQGLEPGGADMRALQGAAQQGIGGTNFLSQLGQQYSTRLAQAMAAAQADAGSMGSAIKASSLGNLENSYANALAQIGLIGLQ